MYRIKYQALPSGGVFWLREGTDGPAAYVANVRFATSFTSFETAVVNIKFARRKLETDGRLTIQEFIDFAWVRCNHQPIDVIVNELVELKIGKL